MTTIDEQISKAEQNLQRKLDWVERHDTRVAFAAGGTIAMLGVLAAASAAITDWRCGYYIVFGSALILQLVALTMIYFSQYPKTTPYRSSLLFFGSISKMSLKDFSRKFKAQTKDEYLDDLIDQVHINSEILSKKFENLKIALILAGISTFPWLLSIYFSKIYFK